MELWEVGLIVLMFNIPFGYWRANTRKFSLQWVPSIHLPVPFVIALRIFGGLGWQFITFPVLISSFFAGQLVGSLIFKKLSLRENVSLTSCLLMDLLRGFK